MVNHSGMRLGKLAVKDLAHIPDLARYAVSVPLPTPPEKVDWSAGVPFTMLANDAVGDCTAAAVLHAWQIAERWRDGSSPVPCDEEAIANYCASSGYQPGKPETDRGAALADVMEQWRTSGFTTPLGNSKISGFSKITNNFRVKEALWLLGPLVVGVNLPYSAQTQAIWQTPANLNNENEPGSWGGHAITLAGIDEAGRYGFVTWGELKWAEAGWVKAYMDECYAPVQPAWLGSGHVPSGLLADAILADTPV